MAQCPSLAALIQEGYLVPPILYSWRKPNLAGVTKTAGDYNLDELGAEMNKPELVGDAVAEWKRTAAGRQTIVFAVNIKHSMAICEAFLDAGIRACHLDGTTPPREREDILARLADGRLQVVSNCAVLTEGWDCPIASCVIIARPTLSLSLYLQMAGRVLRTHPGKSDCIILDHGGCYHEHGHVLANRDWQLEGDRKRRKSESIKARDDFKVCPECGQVAALDVLVCGCGYVFSIAPAAKEVKHKPGLLERIENEPDPVSREERMRKHYEWLLFKQHVQTKKNGESYASGYAFMQFCSQFQGKRPKRGWREEWVRKHPELVEADRIRRQSHLLAPEEQASVSS